MFFLMFCLIAGCAGFDEDFENEQSFVGQSNTRSQGMGPGASRIDQMRAARMSSLGSGGSSVSANRSGGSSGNFGSTNQNTDQSRQQKAPKEDTRFLQSGVESYNIGNYQEAIGALTQFYNQYPASDSTPEALFFLGESYFKLGNYQKALTAYKKVDIDFTRYPRAGEALYKAGKCLAAMGNKTIAKRVFKKIKTKYPNFDPKSIRD